MRIGTGTAILDFGTGSNEASVSVTGKTSILATSKEDTLVIADDVINRAKRRKSARVEEEALLLLI